MSDYLGVRELLRLPPSECLGECSRSGGSTFRLLQLQVIGHQVALRGSCLDHLPGLVEPERVLNAFKIVAPICRSCDRPLERDDVLDFEQPGEDGVWLHSTCYAAELEAD